MGHNLLCDLMHYNETYICRTPAKRSKMKIKILILSSLFIGACSEKPQSNFVPLPAGYVTLAVDSVDSGVLLNPIDLTCTSRYLVVANLQKDTIFDVFDNKSMKYLYSDLVAGQGPNDMLAMRSIKSWDEDKFYVTGFGVPSFAMVNIRERMKVDAKKNIPWENDVCQNMYLLTENEVLLQPTKRNGEWVLYDILNKKTTEIPTSPFANIQGNEQSDFISAFQKRTSVIAVKKDGSLFALFYMHFPYMRIFDKSGRMIFETSVGTSLEQVIDESSKEEKGIYFGRCSQSDDLIFIKYNPSDSKCDAETHLQVWDWEGNLLCLLKVPVRMDAFAVTPDGKSLFGIKVDSDNIYHCDLTNSPL